MKLYPSDDLPLAIVAEVGTPEEVSEIWKQIQINDLLLEKALEQLSQREAEERRTTVSDIDEVALGVRRAVLALITTLEKTNASLEDITSSLEETNATFSRMTKALELQAQLIAERGNYQ